MSYPWNDLRLLESNQDKRNKGPLSARWTTLLFTNKINLLKKYIISVQSITL